MSNELLWFIFLLLNISTVVAFYHFFGRTGLYIVITYSIILCNIQVLKQVQLFGLDATLGNVLYAGIFLATDMLSEFYGKRDAQRGVIIGFAATVIMALFMQIALFFEPNAFDEVDPSLRVVFGLVPSIVAASLLAYLCSQFHDVFLYHKLKKLTRGRHMWLRNNLSTISSQLIDSLVFTGVATWLGAFPPEAFWTIFLVAYVIKVIVAACDTPFLYLARRLKPRSEL